MATTLPKMLDAPEKQIIGVSLIYSFFCFFSLPFILLLITLDIQHETVVMSWFEIGFHLLNFLVIGLLFKEYLSFGFVNLRINKKEVLIWAGIAAAASLGIGFLWQKLADVTESNALYLAAAGTLPVTEMDMQNLAPSVVHSIPAFGTLCMVFVVPILTCCIYYGAVFPAAYNHYPWLGYLVVALITAFPRFLQRLYQVGSHRADGAVFCSSAHSYDLLLGLSENRHHLDADHCPRDHESAVLWFCAADVDIKMPRCKTRHFLL